MASLSRGWRWTLIVLAVIGLAMGGLNLAFGTVPSDVRERLSARAARANLDRIGAALLEYAERHGDGRHFPPALETLFETGILADRGVLVCPSSMAAGLPPPHFAYAPALALDLPCPAAVEHQALVAVYQRGQPETYQGTRYSYGLKSDLSVFTSRVDLEPRVLAQGGTSAREGASVARELAAADAARRRLAAWELGRGPLGADVRVALADALGSPDPETVLYAGLALARSGDRAGARAALDALEQRLRWTTGDTSWLVSGPRRRVVIETLARAFAPTVQPFAYDPEPAQLAAFAAWRAELEDGPR